jgi:hypothetical protein
MRIHLDTDEAYESFQLWWLALQFASRAILSPVQIAIRAQIRTKLRAVGRRHDQREFVLVPRTEGEILELDDGERFELATALCEVEWNPERVEDAITAGRLLGCDLGRGREMGERKMIYSVRRLVDAAS